MTILFFTPKYFPDIGGVEKHVQKLSEVLISQGHSIIIVTEAYQPEVIGNKLNALSNWQSIKAIAKTINVKKMLGVFNNNSHKKKSRQSNVNSNPIIYRMPKFRPGKIKKFNIWFWLWSNRQLIQKADIIHCHDVFYWYMPFRYIFGKKPVFTTFHGYEGYPIKKSAILIRKLSEKMSWGNICVGEFIKKWYGTKTPYVIYGGIEKQKNTKISKKQHQSNKVKILLVGRLADDIGIGTYSNALSKLQKKKFPFELEVVGDGPLRNSIENYGTVHGFVKEIDTYIRHADIVFASSYLSILEALFYGKNVIAVYNNPLKEDYLKMSPFKKWIQICGTSDEIVDNIEQYHKTNISQQLLHKAKQWADSQTWEQVAEIYYKLWKENKS